MLFAEYIPDIDNIEIESSSDDTEESSIPKRHVYNYKVKVNLYLYHYFHCNLCGFIYCKCGKIHWVNLTVFKSTVKVFP